MQSNSPRALDRRLKEDWARDAGEGPMVLMSLRVDFGPMGCRSKLHDDESRLIQGVLMITKMMTKSPRG